MLGRRPVAARREAVLRSAREVLDGLEAQLVEEDRVRAEEVAELSRGWACLQETVERCRRKDEAAQAQREAALRSAEEIRISVVRELEETLADLSARREALEAETEAKHQELAAREAAVSTKHKELLDREAGIIAESETVRQGLEKLREDLRVRENQMVQRGAELDARETELRKREEQVEQIEKDQSAQREHLESRESKVTQDEAFYQKRLALTNENLRKKEEQLAAESATKEQLFRDNCRKDFVDKAKK